MSFDIKRGQGISIAQLLDAVDSLSMGECQRLAGRLEKRGIALRFKLLLSKLKDAKLDERTIRRTTEKVRARLHGEAETGTRRL